jgi:hypothetical protein
MATTNPYQSPPEVGPAPDRLLIRNFNHAGGALAMAFVIGPLLIAGTIGLIVTGRMRAPLEGQLTILSLMVLAEIAGLIYAVRVPTLWVELGPTLRYGSLATLHEVEWGNVQRIWFDREDESALIGPVRVTLSANQALAIQINDYNDLRVVVPSDKLQWVKAILSRHPRFKDSPYDEDAIDAS